MMMVFVGVERRGCATVTQRFTTQGYVPNSGGLELPLARITSLRGRALVY